MRYSSYTLLYIASSGFLEGVFSQSIEKKRVKRLSVEKKCVPLQADYYQISDKSLIYSALLCLFVSDGTQGVAKSFLVVNKLKVLKEWIL